jgi:hypothetical protein
LNLVLLKLGSTKWITFEIDQNLFDVTGRGSPKMVLNVDGTGPIGAYSFFIEVVDSGGAKLNTVLSVIIVADSSEIIQEEITNAMIGNLTRFDNETLAMNSTNTTEDSNSTNTTSESNSTETNTTECNKTAENSSCEENTTADSNLTN